MSKSGETKRKRLTPKEKAFTKEYIRGSKLTRLNGTQSALKVYNTEDKKVAGVIATENLSKPKVQREIVRLMDKHGLTDDRLLEVHTEGLEATTEKGMKDYSTRHRYLDLAYKLKGHTDPDKQGNTTNVAFIINKA